MVPRPGSVGTLDIWQIGGFLGIALGAAAYVPQIVHLANEHCSAGVSLKAWALWAVAAVLIGFQALRSDESVFVWLQVVGFLASATIFALGWRYRGMRCPVHQEWKDEVTRDRVQ